MSPTSPDLRETLICHLALPVTATRVPSRSGPQRPAAVHQRDTSCARPSILAQPGTYPPVAIIAREDGENAPARLHMIPIYGNYIRIRQPLEQTMNKAPTGWPRVSVSIFYDDASAAIDWLCRVFGFEVRLKVEGEGGRIEHSELTFAEDGLVMVGQSGGRESRPGRLPCRSPRAFDGASTAAFCVYLDDVDAHCSRVRAAGARILEEPKTSDYGEDYWSDRGYRCADLEGHQWWFVQRVRDQKA